MKHLLNLIHKISVKGKSTGKQKPCRKPRKIIVVETTPTIQEPKLREVAKNTNIGSTLQGEP